MAYRRDFRVIGRRPPARMAVRFPEPGLAAVRVDFPGGGTGRAAAADRLDLLLGLLAWGVHGTDEPAVRAAADRIRAVATAIAATSDGMVPPGTLDVPTRARGPVPLEVVEWPPGRGGTTVTMELVRSAVGFVPRRRGSGGAVPLLLAGLAAAMWEARDDDPEGRLALALALEGVTSWYREAHRLTPPRDAVASARAHAADRMRAAGRALPPSLAGGPG